MILAFYSVDSSYDRDIFNLYDTTKKDDCLEIYGKLLKEENARFYDMGDKYDIVALETDYNDELLDGGYWMIVLYAINNDIVNEHFNL